MPKKKLSYQEKRKSAFEKKIPIGDQLDAVLKAFDMVLQSNENNLPYDLIDIVEKWQAIKAKYPKNK